MTGLFKFTACKLALYKSSDTMRANTASGKRIIELTNQAEEESTVSYHVFFDTITQLQRQLLKRLLETVE